MSLWPKRQRRRRDVATPLDPEGLGSVGSHSKTSAVYVRKSYHRRREQPDPEGAEVKVSEEDTHCVPRTHTSNNIPSTQNGHDPFHSNPRPHRGTGLTINRNEEKVATGTLGSTELMQAPGGDSLKLPHGWSWRQSVHVGSWQRASELPDGGSWRQAADAGHGRSSGLCSYRLSPPRRNRNIFSFLETFNFHLLKQTWIQSET